MMTELSKLQLRVLEQYAHTSDSRYMQEIKGAAELWKPLGLLVWRGEQYGTNFYSITESGLRTLELVHKHD